MGLKNWIEKMIGKEIAKKLGLQEGPAMENKKWYKSKGVWSAVLFTLLGGVEGISTALGHPIVIPDWVKQILMGLGIYGIRTSTQPIAPIIST